MKIARIDFLQDTGVLKIIIAIYYCKLNNFDIYK